MAHNLTIQEDGTVEFFSAVTKGWHQLGQTSERKLTWEEAMEESKTGWEVEKVPVLHQGANGELLTVPNQVVVRRTDNFNSLGVVSNTYQTIQNSETFEFVNEIVGEGQACWDTAGSIDGGRIVFMQVELEGNLFLNANPDDKTLKKVLFINSHDGSKAFMGMITPIRVVCQNTLNAALGNHKNQFKIYHRKNYQSKKQEAQKILGLASAYYDDLQTIMNTLAETPVSHSYIQGFLNTLIPALPDASTGKIPSRTQNRKDDIENLIINGKGNSGRTKWDIWNGVTEYVDYQGGSRIVGKKDMNSDDLMEAYASQRFERAILGTGAVLKQKAMDLLLN